ncbi:hypothetical protein ACU4GR_21800 [Methylobacterium oryzae CBMB20]
MATSITVRSAPGLNTISPGKVVTVPGISAEAAPRIGWCTVTSFVPSGKVAST